MNEHWIKFPEHSLKVICNERQVERENIAAELNNSLRQAEKYNWPKQYQFALTDLQKRLKFKGTYLELIK